jgi:hypothetical protein
MSIVSGRLGFAVALAALCLSGLSAHAQVTPVPYWTSGWSPGFNGSLTADQSSNTYGNFPSCAGSDARSGNTFSRYNFSNGWFVGSERGLGMGGFNQVGAFSNTPSFSYEGAQFGYNFKSAPVTVYAGFDALNYNTGISGPFAPFDSLSSTAPGYSAHAGVEFRPMSNLSLSLGVGFAQQFGSIDSNLLALPGASPFAFGARR